MSELQLSNTEARLTYLAVRYHLARPGSELDPETKQPVARGLAEAAAALEPQLGQPRAAIDLSEHQHRRLISATAGALNELKQYGLLQEGRQTTVPSFHEARLRLFPDARAPEDVAELAAQMMSLRRRLEQQPPDDAPTDSGRAPAPWWRFWQRS